MPGKLLRLFALSLILLLPAAHGSERQAEPLTIMTFNIRYGTANDGANQWSARKDHLFEVIRRENADLLGLQEALDFQIDEIIKAAPMYAVVGVGRDDGRGVLRNPLQ